jgi:hypothetical protein
MSYSLSPDQEFQLIQLLLYIFGFVALILIFLYIAYERPAGPVRKKASEEDEE